MDAGRIQQVGSPNEIYQLPATPLWHRSLVPPMCCAAGCPQATPRWHRCRWTCCKTRLTGPLCARSSTTRHSHRAGWQWERCLQQTDRRRTHSRMVNLGAHVKLDLALTTGDVVTVHVARREYDNLGLVAGNRCWSTWKAPACS